MHSSKKPKQEQIDEWCDSEVTLHFLALLREQLDDAHERRSDVFFPFEPMKTQEAKSHLLGAEGVWADIIEAIETKDFEGIELEPATETING